MWVCLGHSLEFLLSAMLIVLLGVPSLEPLGQSEQMATLETRFHPYCSTVWPKPYGGRHV